ncbi:MAG: HEAT repeat domain-containing protein [Cyanobacteria bacterium P01_F01_bin.150]
MTNQSNQNNRPSITGLSSIPPRLSQEYVDELLSRVGEQVVNKTFDTGQDEVFNELVEALGDVRGMKRLRAATLLGEEIGTPSTPFLMEALLNHPNVVVRRASAKTLTLIGNPDAIPALLHALFNDEDTVVKGSTVGALARTGKVAAPELLNILSSDQHSESIKGHAAWALAFMGTEAESYLVEALSSESATVRAAVIGAIAKLLQDNPDEKSFQILMDALEDPDEMIRCEAISSLGNLAHQPAVGKLVALLKHTETETRKSAALALMKMGDRTALEPLNAALEAESDEALKPILKLAFTQLDKKTAVNEDDDWF